MSDPRSKALLEFRPEIASVAIHDEMSTEEQFQNETLRPIIKVQHDLLVRLFRQNLKRKKDAFFKLPIAQRPQYIHNVFSNDMQFKNQIKGIIIGMFTLEEFKQYEPNASALNKRMMSIVKKRMLDSMHEVENLESSGV